MPLNSRCSPDDEMEIRKAMLSRDNARGVSGGRS